MVTNSLIYVAQVAAPALLLASAWEAWRRRRTGLVAAIGWTLAALCLIPAAIFPGMLTWLETRSGLRLPGPVVAAVGIAGLVSAWWSHSPREIRTEPGDAPLP